MSRMNVKPEALSIQGRRFSARRLVPMIVLLLMLIIPAGAIPARAAPSATWETYRLYHDVPFGTKICVGEKRTIHVRVQKRVLGWHGIIQEAPTYPSGQMVGVSPTGSEVGGLDSSSAVTGMNDPTLSPNAQFVFTAKKKGEIKVKFTDLGPFSRSAPDRWRASDVEVKLVVTDCSYQLVAFSDWVHPKGFNPRMNSVIDAEIKLDQNLNVIPVFPRLENVARHTRPFNWFICSHPIIADETEVKITGRLDQVTGKLLLVLDYGVVTAQTKIRCPTPVGVIGGGSIDMGEPLVLISRPLNTSFSAGGGGEAYPHVLQADVDVPGVTAVVVVPIYLP